MVKGGNAYRLVTDQLGSVRAVVDVLSGSVVQEMEYDAWGRVLSDSNPGFQSLGFAGGIWDEQTGLVRFGRRDYDSEVGRFVAKDPIGFEGDGPNLYTYVLNNPANLVDPNGEFVVNPFVDSIWIPACVIAAIIAANQAGEGPGRYRHCMLICTYNRCRGNNAPLESAGLGLGLEFYQWGSGTGAPSQDDLAEDAAGYACSLVPVPCISCCKGEDDDDDEICEAP